MLRALATFVAVLLGALPAQADYPERPVRIIVPVAAGGGVDVMARLMAQKLGERFGQQFVVENRPGAGGIIGVKVAISAPADGYTLLYTPSALSLAVAVNKTPPYDVARDFTPISNVAISPYALVVNNGMPTKNLQEFIAYAKAHPDKVNYGSAGVGTGSHLAGELLKTMAGIEMTHVPNKGINPALIDLMGGQVQAMFASVPALLSEKGGRIRLIAMAEKKRSPLLVDLPTIDESGLPGFEAGNWVGFLAPAGLDPALVNKLNAEIIAIMDTPEMKAKFDQLGFDRIGSTPGEFGVTVREDVDKWREVIKRAGIALN
jgi:tripartite-type tricarboxylate transporter receptor subunit TctC